MIEIDPFEAVITLARLDSDLNAVTNGQIDLWHHYGQDSGDWPLDSRSLTLVPTPISPFELDDLVQRIGLEARCHADTPVECGQVYMKFVDWLRIVAQRKTLETRAGKALVFYVVPLTSPRLGFDIDARPNGGIPYFSVPLRAEVSELIVT